MGDSVEGKLWEGASWSLRTGDCAGGMALLADASVDFVFADPPYNMRLGESDLRRPDRSKVKAVDDEWDRFASVAEYDRMTREWLGQVRRVLRDDGTMMVIGSYHNIYRIGSILEDMGFWTLNDIVWSKPNPMPNFRGARLANAHETILWVAKSADARFTFNYEALKGANDDRQLGSVWHIPICGGRERLRGADGARLHSTQKPEALLARAIACATKPGAVVLDPFTGSGTTGAVAVRMGRRFLGMERDPGYAAIAAARIGAVTVPPGADVALPTSRREARKVSFLEVLGLGLVSPGEILVMRGGRARVREDGLIASECGRVGSIHKVGALVRGADACNGWDVWAVEREEGAAIPIDALRAKAREMLAGL